MELFADELLECVQQKSIYEVINVDSCRNIIGSSDKYCDRCFNQIHETKLSGHAHVSAYFCIGTITKASSKFKQVPFKRAPQV